MEVCRCAGVEVCKCTGVQVCRHAGVKDGLTEVGDDGGDALVEAEPVQELLAAALQVGQGEPAG